MGLPPPPTTCRSLIKGVTAHPLRRSLKLRSVLPEKRFGVERQLQKHDPQTVLSLLAAERIRRATQLNKAIAMDLAARELTRETAGLEELFQAVESLYRHVADLLKDREA